MRVSLTSNAFGAGALVAGLCAFALGAGGAVAEPGVSKDKIRIGTYGPFTGPVSLYGHPVANGALAYYNEINAQGGIHGRKIEFVYEDGMCDPAKTRAAAKKLVFSDDVLMVHGGSCSGPAFAARSEFINGQVPMMIMTAVLDKISAPTEKYIFTTTQPAGQDGLTMVKFALSIPNLKSVAIVKNSDDWAEAHLQPIYEQLKKAGVKIAADVVLERNASDATTQVLQVANGKPDAVLLVAYPNESATFLRDAQKYGFESPVIGASSNMDMLAVAERAGGMAAVKNFYVSAYLRGPVDGPEMKQYADLFRKYFPDAKLQTLNFYGMSGAYAVVEALKKAGPEPTREKIVTALESLKNVPAGPAYCEVTFTKEQHQGCLKGHVWGIRDGKVVVIGESWRAKAN